MNAKKRIGNLASIVLALWICGSASAVWARGEGEAISGVPFGIARVSLDIPPGEASKTRGFSLVEETGRAHYPAYQAGGILGKIGGVLEIGAGILGGERPLAGGILGGKQDAAPSAVTVFFLFTGEAPLKLTVYTPTPQTITLSPRREPPRVYDRLLKNWWREYNANVRAQAEAGDYPPLVETYLTSMLAQRLALEPPLLSRATEKKPSEPLQTLELIAGAESLRLKAMRETMARPRAAERADQVVPEDIAWTAPPPTEPGEKPAVEPIAMHVPEECFYIRFGKFSNHVWMNHLEDEFGGDISRMVSMRGQQDDSDLRTQKQLALEDSVLGDLLGDAIIADVAMIGRDTYTREGAAVGMLFQARNALLGPQFRREREDTLKAEKASGAKLETVKLGGRDVSFLSTPDGRLRSYYAVDGDYHLFTTCKAIAERFFEVGAGRGALGASPEFHEARKLLPLARDDTVFVYFSSAYFRGLVSPQYQIEMARRIQSVTDIELVQLAQLAARGEGAPADTIDDLVEAGLLPRGFGRRADGSGPVLERGKVVDSLRGERGLFTPILDVPLRGVTREEAVQYAARAEFYRREWKQMDPLMVGIKRYALDRRGGEKIVVDAYISPFMEQKYGWITSVLGPGTTERIAPAPGDLVNVQAVVAGGVLAPLVPPHFLFLGIQDSPPLADAPAGGGLFKNLQMLQSAPGYLGAWPKPGFLDLLPLGLLGAEPDRLGYTKFPLGIWRREWEGFSVLAFDRALLAAVTPALKPEETDQAAQVRVQVKDLTGTKLSAWVNDLYYERAFKTSLGNTRLLSAMSDQLHVPSEDALATAEKLLDVKLVCALGGKYQKAKDKNGVVYWESTKWPGPAAKVEARGPDEFHAPLLDWFRGLDGRLTKEDGKMVAHLEIDMQRKGPETKIELPLFNLFGGKKEKNDEPKAVPAEPLPAPKAPPKKPKEF